MLARFALPILALASLATSGAAQDRMAGKGQFPEARSFSGLSGGGAAVLPSGRPSIKGALALSTPIGYTLGEGHGVLFGGTTSTDSNFRWFDGDVATNGSNGSAAAIVGTSFGPTNVSLSILQTSRLPEDRVVNIQVSPGFAPGRAGLSFGVQDLLDETTTTPNYHESARSFFVATTYKATSDAYLTIGTGTKRFSKGFLNASAPVAPWARSVVEHDGYAWNYGLELQLFSPGSAGPRTGASLFIGSCQGRYTTWSLSFRF